jgi:hypothetical protein
MAQYGIGDRVTQAQYGDGTVTRSDSHHTVIDFDAHGPRTFVSGRVVLGQATTAAPEKKPRRAVRKPKVPKVAAAPVVEPEAAESVVEAAEP